LTQSNADLLFRLTAKEAVPDVETPQEEALIGAAVEAVDPR
jgi:hypothetical protein